jgi:hypothetical protein
MLATLWGAVERSETEGRVTHPTARELAPPRKAGRMK